MQLPAPMCLRGGGMNATALHFPGAMSLPLGSPNVWSSSLMPEQKFCATLVVVSDPSVTLLQKNYTQVSRIANEL